MAEGLIVARNAADAATQSAEATRKSVDLAERQMLTLNQQWLGTDNWKAEATVDRLGTRIHITFDIVNSSGMAVNLVGAEIGLDDGSHEWSRNDMALLPGARFQTGTIDYSLET